MKVPLLDLKAQYCSIKECIDRVVAEVFESQAFILGGRVKACEEAIASYCQSSYGVGVSSGSDALLIALMAEEIGLGARVITSPYTFFATAGAIWRTGARPVFVDIEPDSYNLDTTLIEGAIDEQTRAILPVHLFGQMADMDPIMALAEAHELVVIEDAAQAIGSEYHGRRAGSIGHYGCFSFFPSKNLGAAGDGGMVTSGDARRADLLASLRSHGARVKYLHEQVGGNFRLDALQAAIVSAKLPYLDDWTRARQANAERYAELFRSSRLDVAWSAEFDPASARLEAIFLPVSKSGRHIYNQYVIRVPKRDELRAHLSAAEIGTAIYYPQPLHLQECFRELDLREGALPQSERAARETLALPIYPELSQQQIELVVESIEAFYVH